MNKEQKSELENKISLVMKFGSYLHQYGAPAHRLERILSNISKSLHIDGQFFSTPTSIMSSFETPIGRRPAMVRIEPGHVELEKTILIDKVAEELIAKNISIAEASKRIDEIVSKPSPYNYVVSTLCFALVSAIVAILFHGGIREIVYSFVIGIVVGQLEYLAYKHKQVERIYESIAAFLAVIFSAIIFYYTGNFSTQIVILSSLVVLFPGLVLTIAVQELATLNLVSGTARLMHAAIIFFKLAFGVVLGNKIVTHIFPNLENITVTYPVPNFVEWIALAFAPFAFMVLFKARPKEALWIFLASILGIISSRLGSHYFGFELGAFLGALAVGLGSNLYARFMKKPAAVTMLPGIILLVPGSIGFRGISSMLEQNVIMGMDLGFTMLITAMALVAGLLFANIMVTANRSL